MPGEKILIIDNSSAVQDMASRILEDSGFRVYTAGNGLAAVSFPDITAVSVILIDKELDELTGEETIRLLKTDEQTYKKPLLMLVAEDVAQERGSENLYGAEHYLLKPFDAQQLIDKISFILEEEKIKEKAGEFTQAAADKFMAKLADEKIQTAVDQKSQIIVEKCLQNIVNLVDKKAREEVETKVESLTEEKEQQLVKEVVHEVAQSMVEKLAERKVTEVMDTVLQESTDRTVKQAASSIIPSIIREKIKDSIESILNREASIKVQKAAENVVPDISNKIIALVESVAEKIVPKVTKEVTPELAKAAVKKNLEKNVPEQIKSSVMAETQEYFDKTGGQVVSLKVKRATRIIYGLLIGNFVVSLGIIGFLVYYLFVMPK